ncbi:hypothetical protein AMECASPLE_035052 [Ameca splendens]|uniref:Uncharacterized protein n=1 Tax=Ameca splendens TaxID=208324 RepID=A0ABV0YUD0_9TELE
MIGVNCVDDLSSIKTEDLEGYLPPIQCRRVIQAFGAESQVELTTTAEPLQQNNHQLQPFPASSGSMECSSYVAYVVPWHKMPPNLMLAVGEKKRPKPRERQDLVCIIVDDILSEVQGRPGRAKLRNVAKQIVEQYPCSF